MVQKGRGAYMRTAEHELPAALRMSRVVSEELSPGLGVDRRKGGPHEAEARLRDAVFSTEHDHSAEACVLLFTDVELIRECVPGV